MKPSAIYALPALPQEKSDFDLTSVKHYYHDHLPELRLAQSQELKRLDDPSLSQGDTVKIKRHVDINFHGGQCLIVGSLWFYDKPVMIYRHAGRSGHDENDRVITNGDAFFEMLAWIHNFLVVGEPDVQPDLVENDADLPFLDAMYGVTMADLVTNPTGEQQ